MQLKKTQNCQSSSKGKEQNWRHKTLPDFRQYCEVTSIKIHWFWQKNRHMDQRNRINSTEIYPSTHSQLVCNRGGKDTQCRRDSLFSKWCLESWTATCKAIKLKHTLTPHIKINKTTLVIKHKTGHHKTPTREQRQTFTDKW